MNLEEIQHLIDCAYDCDAPELVPALELKLAAIKASMPVEPVTPWTGCDPLADISALLGLDVAA
jgi:hypothetical protein